MQILRNILGLLDSCSKTFTTYFALSHVCFLVLFGSKLKKTTLLAIFLQSLITKYFNEKHLVKLFDLWRSWEANGETESESLPESMVSPLKSHSSRLVSHDSSSLLASTTNFILVPFEV